VVSASKRGLDRLINFTDAVVAIAITLLILPLVSIGLPDAGTTVWTLLSEQAGRIYSFAISFLVVAQMWRVHNRVFNALIRYDNRIFALNLLWLISIVFLPWPTALLGEATSETNGDNLQGAGLLYWSTLAVISAAGNLVALHARHTPGLMSPNTPPIPRWAQFRGLLYSAMMLIFGIASIWWGANSMWLALLFIPLGILTRESIAREGTKHDAEQRETERQ